MNLGLSNGRLYLVGCRPGSFLIRKNLKNSTFAFIYGFRKKNRFLDIEIGIFRMNRIPIMEISRIIESKDTTASPANSLDRLEVDYDGESVLISPENKFALVEELLKINYSI